MADLWPEVCACDVHISWKSWRELESQYVHPVETEVHALAGAHTGMNDGRTPKTSMESWFRENAPQQTPSAV